LLKHGANPNMICERETGNTAVHYAFKKNALIMIILLLQYRGDLYKLNKDEKSPLDLALPDTKKQINRII